MESFSTTFFCPMYSSSVGGRSVRLKFSSSVEISSGETSRCLGIPDSVERLRSPALYQHLRQGERQTRRRRRQFGDSRSFLTRHSREGGNDGGENQKTSN